MCNDTSEQSKPPLVIVLNQAVAEHFPPGDVDYVEVIRASMAIATAYQRALESREPMHANHIRDNASAIAKWMQANPR